MSPRPSLRLLFAAAAFTCCSVFASAQITTMPLFTGDFVSFAPDEARVQTFSNVSYFDSMTYQFVRTGGFGPVSVDYYFVEWDTNTNQATSLIASGSALIPDAFSFSPFLYTDVNSNPGTYNGWEQLISLQVTANPVSTYAMVLVTSDLGASDLALAAISTVDSLPNGQALFAVGVTDYASLASTTGTSYGPGADFGFASLSIQLSPVPEPATAAAGIGALLVAGLVALRLYRRRQEEAVALAPVAAE